MSKKQKTEWLSRILWLLGVLFLLMACVCFVIMAFKIGFTATAQYQGDILTNTISGYEFNKTLTGSLVTGASKKLLVASALDLLIGFVCYIIAKVLHWSACKGE